MKNTLQALLFFGATLTITAQNTTAKFEPKDGECLVFIGQDLEATGGLDKFGNGYTNHFESPFGITTYTNLSPGEQSYAHFNKGIDGIKTAANWGAGYNCAQCYLEDSDYNYSSIAIGLSIVNHENLIARGKHDQLIIDLAQWIKSSNRPVFLRIGYEFDGWDWNHYHKTYYLKAWKQIHKVFKEQNVHNVAFVWQSKGTGSNQKTLEDWYPGDDLVDWCAYSYFGKPDQEMLTFARRHRKPIFIAEATPVMETDNLYFNTDLSDPKVAAAVWKHWFIPFFKTINDNQDVIKGFSYINSDWASQPMWTNNPTFQKVDSRIQVSTFISEAWKRELAKPKYIKPSQNLLNTLMKSTD
ncbi:MAG: 1,4-beta-xylanase [Psychroserpens sp.]|uniref:1,4-beta-xylanase n=1 Tax=Psychroserpens sp. TaxID=2020870 RepID=UPI003CBCF54A